MNKSFFIKKFLIPAAFFSFISNSLLLAPTFFMMELFRRVVPTHNEDVLWLLIGQLSVAIAVMGAVEVVRSRILVAANNTIDALLAPAVFRKMLDGANSPEGNKNSWALRDLQTVRTFLTGQAMIQLFDVPFMPFYLILLFLMNPVLFYLLIFVLTLMGGITLLGDFMTKAALSEASSANREASRFVDAALLNGEVVNAMGMQANLIKRWAWLNDRVMILQSKASNRSGGISGVTKSVRQFTQALGMAVGAYVILHDPTFSSGLMMAGGILYGKTMGPLESIITGWKGIRNARAAYGRLEDFFNTMVDDRTYLMELPPPTGQLTLEHVTFGIRSTGKVIVRDLSFNIDAGEFLGIVGPSASGKSTLARLLTNVWKPMQGVIRMDGSDIAGWPPDRLGRHMGYLPQDIELFSGTIAENISRFDEPDPDKVLAAAKLAGLHDIILHMPNGYDTQIGDGGTVLSGGQRQRIGFARAAYGNPKILVLDEPNASLDTAGEMALIEGLKALKQAGKTTIIITHNPNFLHHVDKLLVMQNGEKVAFGPKELVMAQVQQIREQPKVAAQ